MAGAAGVRCRTVQGQTGWIGGSRLVFSAWRLQGSAVLGAQQPGLAHGRLQAGKGAVVDGALYGGQLQPAVLVHTLRQVQLPTYASSELITRAHQTTKPWHQFLICSEEDSSTQKL